MDEQETQEDGPETYSRALWKFRSIVRTVMNNIPWLNEGKTLSESVQKNVRLLMSKKLTSIFKLKIKSLLLTPPETRTKEQITIIFRAISQLKSLRAYPESVVMKIAACATFRYFEQGRVILKQGHPAHSLYFVVTGELKVYVTQPGEDTAIQISTLRMGEMFGEISLINEVPRGATITCSSSVELLMVDGEDFKSVLKESLKGKQGYVLKFLDSLSYFNDWDYKTRLNSSLLCQCEKFSKDQTILGESTKKDTFVYFVMSGVCRLIEDMDVDVKINQGGYKSYTLHKYPPTKRSTNVQTRIASIQSNHKDEGTFRATWNHPTLSSGSEIKNEDDVKSNYEEHNLNDSQNIQVAEFNEISRAYSKKFPNFGSSRNKLKSREELHKRKSEYFWTKTIFMEIATFTEKACFCLGENMKRRRIVAVTDVECLLLPHSFISEGPNAVTWARIRIFLDKNIPSTKQIFEEFKRQKCWRDNIAKNMSLHRAKNNFNNIHNVPYFIRIMNDFDYMSYGK